MASNAARSSSIAAYAANTATGDILLSDDVILSAPGNGIRIGYNTGMDFYGGTVVLEILQTHGGTGDLAIDTINFDQKAPEPGAAMVMLPLLLTTLAQRRRQR